ncbi:MAG: trigger factor [Desulfobulbaceae bacterium]|nr:trigger factor [Desulfobulbaceae bacterium]
MKTSLEEISTVKKKVVVEIESSEVDKKLNQSYATIGKKAKIPGFRPGKIPRKILESYFGSQVMDDVTRELISESFPKAIDEINSFPLGQPILEKDILKPGQDFKYSAVIEVRPQFEVKDYSGVEVQKEKWSFDEKQVEEELTRIRESSGKFNPVEGRPAREGDHIVLEYEELLDGNPVDGTKTSNQMMLIGRNDFHPDFDQALVGLNKEEEKQIEVVFEENHPNEKWAGKKVTFKIQVSDLKELELPELDDEFAKKLGPNFETLDILKEEIRKSLTAREEKRVDSQLKERLLDKISEGLDIELPQVMVDSETDAYLERFKMNLRGTGGTLENLGIPEQKLRENFEPMSRKRVKEILMLSQIARQEKMDLTDEDVDQGFREIAEGMGQETETVKKFYEAKGLMDSLKDQFLEEKVLRYLVEHVNISEVEREALVSKEEDR